MLCTPRKLASGADGFGLLDLRQICVEDFILERRRDVLASTADGADGEGWRRMQLAPIWVRVVGLERVNEAGMRRTTAKAQSLMEGKVRRKRDRQRR